MLESGLNWHYLISIVVAVIVREWLFPTKDGISAGKIDSGSYPTIILCAAVTGFITALALTATWLIISLIAWDFSVSLFGLRALIVLSGVGAVVGAVVSALDTWAA